MLYFPEISQNQNGPFLSKHVSKGTYTPIWIPDNNFNNALSLPVIVEEAAEVLEAHVLVSLVGEVEHLVMIGKSLLTAMR